MGDWRELIELPSDFLFKVIGKPGDFSRDNLVGISETSTHRDLAPERVRSTASKTGRYLSWSVEVWVETHEEIEAIYRELKLCPDVVYLL